MALRLSGDRRDAEFAINLPAEMIGGDYEVLHNSSRYSHAVRLKTLNTKVVEQTLIGVDDVCDNLSQAARNLLIPLARRDLRVVEGARLE